MIRKFLIRIQQFYTASFSKVSLYSFKSCLRCDHCVQAKVGPFDNGREVNTERREVKREVKCEVKRRKQTFYFKFETSQYFEYFLKNL